MKYKVSFIIPTYNSGSFMAESLRYIAAQRNEDQTEFEVIVIDDGSSDNTAECIEAARDSLDQLTYIFIPRSENSNRSRARNRGIKAASGQLLCFLDAGIIIPPDYLDTVVSRFQNLGNQVLVHTVLGMNTDPDLHDITVVHKLSPYNLREEASKLSLSPVWLDSRYQLFRMLRDDLDLLTAPWELGLSGAMTVPASLARKVGGFDEDFSGWGSEDIDFSYRLYRAGCSFRAERHAFSLHLPHPINRLEDRMVNDFANKRRIHRKLWRLETEAYPYYQGMFYSTFLEKLKFIDVSTLNSKFSTSFSEHLYNKYIRSTSTSLIMGLSEADVVRELNPTHVFLWNQQLKDHFQDHLSPEINIKCDLQLGCDTPYEDGYFDTAIITDYILLFPSFLVEQMVKELIRTARTLIYVYDSDFDKQFSVQQNNRMPISMPAVTPHLTARFQTELTLSPRKQIMEKILVADRDELIARLKESRREIVIEQLCGKEYHQNKTII